jgi:hypothetical protein
MLSLYLNSLKQSDDFTVAFIDSRFLHTVAFAIAFYKQSLLKQSILLNSCCPFNVFLVRKVWILYASNSKPGVRVPLVVREKLIGGTHAKLKKKSIEAYLGKIFDLGVSERGYNSD